MRKKAFFFLITVLFLLCSFLFFSQKVKVKYTECISEIGCSDEIRTLIDSQKEKSYFLAKSQLSKMLEENSRIESYKIRFIFPETLQVEVVEKKEETALKFADNRFFVFDKNANLISEVSQTNLPTVTMLDLPSDSHMHFGIKLYRDLYKHYGATDAKMDKFGLYVRLLEAREVVFPLGGDIDVLLGSLEVVLLQLNKASENHTIISEAGKNVRVDLRYKNPVILGL